MAKTVIILILTFFFFLLEFFLFNVFGRTFKPNFLILLIIFCNLFWGIRYSIIAAVFAGIMKDSFSTGVLGVSLFSYVAAAYITTFLKTYTYQTGTKLSQFLLVMLVVVINGLLEYLLYMKYTDIHFFDVVKYVLTPDVLTTTIVSVYTFRQLKSCVLKLSA